MVDIRMTYPAVQDFDAHIIWAVFSAIATTSPSASTTKITAETEENKRRFGNRTPSLEDVGGDLAGGIMSRPPRNSLRVIRGRLSHNCSGLTFAL